MAKTKKELHLIDYNGVMVADSREIAEVLELSHYSVKNTVKAIAKSGMRTSEEMKEMFQNTTDGRASIIYMTKEGCKLLIDYRNGIKNTDWTKNAALLSAFKKAFSDEATAETEKTEETETTEAEVSSPEMVSATVTETEVIKSETVSVTTETDEVTINQIALCIKEYKGQRVVTFKDIDAVHERPEGTARKRFNDNKKHFVEGEDYYIVKPADVQMSEFRTSEINNRGTTLITESGYYMLVKSFTDDLSWQVQRELTKSYFRVQQMQRATDSYMIEDPIERAKRWIQEQEEKKALAVKVAEQNQQIEKQNEQIAELSPKAEYCDKVLQTSELVTITDIAKDFGKSAVWLNKKLHEKKVQFKQGSIWHLYQGYAEKGYAVTRTTIVEDRNGREHSMTHTYWTQKGRKFIYDLLAEENILPVIMQEQIIMMPLLEQEEVMV